MVKGSDLMWTFVFEVLGQDPVTFGPIGLELCEQMVQSVLEKSEGHPNADQVSARCEAAT